MPMRNYFRKSAPEPLDGPRSPADGGFQSAAVSGTKPIQIKDSIEFKLSEINDSGVYLPPSPATEKPGFWHAKSNTSIASSKHRSLLSDNEPFSISRESFDSYRRSFDISAKVAQDGSSETYPRQSLEARHSADTRRSADVRRSRATPRSSMQQSRTSETHANVPEETLEDVVLDEEPKPQAPRKRGLFARFGESHPSDRHEDRPTSTHHFSLTGRKRAESGGGAELKAMPKPTTDVSVESKGT